MRFLFMFFIASSALATTTAKEANRSADHDCHLQGIFQKLILDRHRAIVNNESRTGDLVFWSIQVQTARPSDACPSVGEIALRVRGAEFQGEPNNAQLNYPVHISEPAPGKAIELKVRLVKGRDTYLNRLYSEWTLIEVLHE